MIDGILFLWFILTAISLIYVLWDQFTNTPSMRIMTLAWGLIILYTGPLGLFLYLLSCRQPMPGTHDQFINVHWKQAVGSLIHCVAGDATAIILMAILLSFFDLANGWETALEYAAAYLFGLFVFQALFMRSMFKSYGMAVKKTLFAETVSMNMVMTGMFPVIVIFKALYPVSKNPALPYFWGVMSLATLIGFMTAYPINSWMVKREVKHGMMSKPSPGRKRVSHHAKSSRLPLQQSLWITVGTFLLFIGVMWVCSFFVPISFALY